MKTHEAHDLAILSRQQFEELAEPMAKDFDASGMSEDEFETLIEEERQIIWSEKQR